MRSIKLLAVLNAVFFLVHLVLSQLTQLELLNSQTIGKVSDKYPTLFTPAGITFSIWGLIYLALAAFCVYHLVKAYKADAAHEANEDLRRTGYLFMLNNLATGAWTIAWVYEWLLVSVVLMLLQLFTLLAIQLRLNIYDPARTSASRWFTQFPLSIYFGWICIATIANISACLVGFGWDSFGLAPGSWAMLLIAVATLLTVFVVLSRRNPFVGLVTVWAFYGIVLKHQELAFSSSGAISTAAWIGLVVVALTVIFQVYSNAKKQKKENTYSSQTGGDTQ
ncbi:hypothetical protein [Pontibacter akesuensis]|uniref:TspO and MBR related proteins n=1 Tax=Pontibacter akesuensis TaxID=388950 RepID=A0A1I7GLA3_9BACT|nr:hypothetical protein [Pontibacter akesuensis]GHA56177.1 hypothetical protein GCM10007389_04680 [Pontibacter akesuensis]SFU49230.1 hypothetical protein SAMN04487941_1107 [Pontibacter akesuensis]